MDNPSENHPLKGKKMENLKAYVQLVDEIADGLDSIRQKDGEPDHKLLSNVAEKYLSAIQLYNLVLYSFIEEGLDLVFDLTEFYHSLSDAEHPASEMFLRATACSPSALRLLLASHYRHFEMYKNIYKP